MALPTEKGVFIHNGILASGGGGGSVVFKGTLAEVLAHYNITSLNDLPEGSQTIVTDMGANGSWYGSQEAYDELPDSKNSDGVEYRIFDGVSDYLSAENIKYGNSDVQSALDSIARVKYKDVTVTTSKTSDVLGNYGSVAHNIPTTCTILSSQIFGGGNFNGYSVINQNNVYVWSTYTGAITVRIAYIEA